MNTLPQQPKIYLDWIAQAKRVEREADITLLAGSFASKPDIFGTANKVLDLLTEAFNCPPEVEAAYEAWRAEYNAAVDILNRERQARINAREANKIRKAACPSCTATHAGEC